jgi:hypothetical protein
VGGGESARGQEEPRRDPGGGQRDRLLVVFEATVGVLILSGGRRTRLGLAGAIAFHSLLWLFGWIELVWCLVMLPPMILLLVAERHWASYEATSPEPVPLRSR